MRTGIVLAIAAAGLALAGAALSWPPDPGVATQGLSRGGVRGHAPVDASMAGAATLDCAAPSRPIARVDDVVITAAELCAELRLLTGGVDDETVRGLQGPPLLERLIDDRLVAGALAARGLAVAPTALEAAIDGRGPGASSLGALAASGMDQGSVSRATTRHLARETLTRNTVGVGCAADLLAVLRREARIERLVAF